MDITTKAHRGQSWRDVLPIHPAADLFPRMTPDELRALGEDIKKNGLTSAIAVWQTDPKAPAQLLDGRNRLDAIEMAIGEPLRIITWHGIVLIEDSSHLRYDTRHVEGDPYAYVTSVNLHRRNLTIEQKREVVAKLLKAMPDKSDRQIAKMAKVSPTTVGTERHELEASGRCPVLDTRTDAKGVKQPVARARTARRERVAKLKSVASAKERDIRKRHDQWEEWDKKATAEAGCLANRLLILDRDLALTLNRFLYEGGESRFMEALDDALRAIDDKPSEGNGVDPAASAETMKAKFADDDGLDIPASLRRGAP
jgi:hypothetical protein